LTDNDRHWSLLLYKSGANQIDMAHYWQVRRSQGNKDRNLGLPTGGIESRKQEADCK